MRERAKIDTSMRVPAAIVKIDTEHAHGMSLHPREQTHEAIIYFTTCISLPTQ